MQKETVVNMKHASAPQVAWDENIDSSLKREEQFVSESISTAKPAADVVKMIRQPSNVSRGSRTSHMMASRKISPLGEANLHASTKRKLSALADKVADRRVSEQILTKLERVADEDAVLRKASLQASEPSSPFSRFLISPSGLFRNRWDIVVIVALLVVSIVTPFEVSFLQSPNIGLTVLNRSIDVIFCIDIFLNFITPFQAPSGSWMYDHPSIAFHYMRSWFLIDLVSVLPFEMVRMIRLIRLTKLLRIFRASRVLKRWETHMSINYGTLTLCKFVLYMLLLSHWLACLFRLVARKTGSGGLGEGDDVEFATESWVEAYFGDRPVNIGEEYNAALYWAVMTVTTIGYGDVVPKTTLERWVAIIAMMVGGAAYAYIVGSVCGLVASMGEITAHLHRKIDDINVYMDEQNLPNDLRIKVRGYFHYTAKQYRNEHYRQLLHEMSPEMRDEIFRRVNAKWVVLLPFIHCASEFERRAFVTALGAALVHGIFPPQERIIRPGEISLELYIIERGVIMMNKSYFTQPEAIELDDDMPGTGSASEQSSDTQRIRQVDLSSTLSAAEKVILTRGDTIGEDMIMTNARRRYHCLSCTFVEVHKLSKKALMDIFKSEAFPETQRSFKRHVIKLAFRTKIVQVIKKLVNARKREAAATTDGINAPESGSVDLAQLQDEIVRVRKMVESIRDKIHSSELESSQSRRSKDLLLS
ncbi:Potassium voltage-gated channel protein eag [Hondaea fermentalgiana]|uniref:Potassium voltage-gated channel protein eag n=1 Tax=Hondaea fermentalgiana TaxID=2315210 RepID=A0A2R5GL44_9STRA|nr:Potassium voltage-gated channel protein eag [Hondaea fermentalgiana]|eukprot:GBG30458.1 Potassium voltage-gated channel protein eag [Hondaea fermentalgiana]